MYLEIIGLKLKGYYYIGLADYPDKIFFDRSFVLLCSEYLISLSKEHWLFSLERKKLLYYLFRYLFNMCICRGVFCTEDNKKGCQYSKHIECSSLLDTANIPAVLSAEWQSNVCKTINKELMCNEETLRSESAAV